MSKERLALRWKSDAERGLAWPVLATAESGVEIAPVISMRLDVRGPGPLFVLVECVLAAVEDFTALVVSSKKVCGVCRQPLAHVPQDIWDGKHVQVRFPAPTKYGIPADKVQSDRQGNR